MYRKKTFTGLMTRFDSSVSKIYKLNLISCLIHRAYNICSSYSHLTQELENIRRLLCQNGFPLNLTDSFIGKKLDTAYKSENPIPDVPKKPLYIVLPYVSEISNSNVRCNVLEIVGKFYPQLELKLIFKNQFSIGSFFQYKDRVPRMLSSNVVYLYTCALCGATYCGETSRHLQTRIAEHQGISSRTGRPLTNTNSTIFNHKFDTGHSVNVNSFEIVQKCKPGSTKIHESIYIHRNKPSLNNSESSVPLAIL